MLGVWEDPSLLKWLGVGVMVLLGIGGSLVTATRFGSLPNPHTENTLAAVLTAQRLGWVDSSVVPSDVRTVVPTDPSSRREVITHLKAGPRATRGAAVLSIETATDSGHSTSVFYVIAPFEEVDADVVYCRSLGSVARSHGHRKGRADEVVREICDRVPTAHMVWAARRHVGIGLDAETMTNPVAWARWLAEVVEVLDGGGTPGEPPGSW